MAKPRVLVTIPGFSTKNLDLSRSIQVRNPVSRVIYVSPTRVCFCSQLSLRVTVAFGVGVEVDMARSH